jgi:hypothetical protein
MDWFVVMGIKQDNGAVSSWVRTGWASEVLVSVKYTCNGARTGFSSHLEHLSLLLRAWELGAVPVHHCANLRQLELASQGPSFLVSRDVPQQTLSQKWSFHGLLPKWGCSFVGISVCVCTHVLIHRLSCYFSFRKGNWKPHKSSQRAKHHLNKSCSGFYFVLVSQFLLRWFWWGHCSEMNSFLFRMWGGGW